MNIYVVRHGETDWNASGRWQGRADIVLNENGRNQAFQCAEKMRAHDIAAIITSPLKRASETAQIIAVLLGVDGIHEDTDLAEREIGRVSGMTAEERDVAFPNGNYEGMEEWEVLQSRVYNAVCNAAERFYPNDIIIVSHDAAIKALRGKLEVKEYDADMVLGNAEITTLSFFKRTLELV